MGGPIEQFVARIHAQPPRIVLVTSGGGSGAISRLLEVPGASRTLLEAVVPYAEGALVRWLGGRPDQFCAEPTARAMAMAAFRRAVGHDTEGNAVAGVACSASLVSDRPKKGPHRAHVAIQTVAVTATHSIELVKGRRTRAEEERLVTALILNAVAEVSGLDDRLDLELIEDERVHSHQAIAPQPWQDLLMGRTRAVAQGEVVSRVGQPARAIYPGAFNPMHQGHRRIAELARESYGLAVEYEISIENVDKPPLDYYELARRTDQFGPGETVWLTRAATFVQKAELFLGATLLVGADTLRRIADPRYYVSPAACLGALEEIASRGCRFLVFGRDLGMGFVRLADLELPDVLRDICREVPLSEFREDVSSTALRKAGEW